MGSIKDIVEAIEARLVDNSFKVTEEVFDFDTVPDSIIDHAFRIETSIVENPYYSGNISNPREEIEILIAYKALRKTRTQWKTALNDRETLENDLVNHASITGLSSDPLLMMDREATTQKYLEGYLISRLVFTVDYIRDISS
jgi:hypothetical protein